MHGRVISALEAAGAVDRALDVLPDAKAIGTLRAAGAGLSAPELATLMAHVKLDLKGALLAGDLVDHDVFLPVLRGYFPTPLRRDHEAAVDRHPLRREIVATALTNDVVDRGGISYVFRLARRWAPPRTTRSGRSAWSATCSGSPRCGRGSRLPTCRARSPTSWSSSPGGCSTGRRAGCCTGGRSPRGGSEVARFRGPIEDASAHLEEWLVGADRTNLRDRTRAIAERGAPEDLVREVELALDRFGLLDVVEIADLAECDLTVAGELYFRLCERVGLVPLLNGGLGARQDEPLGCPRPAGVARRAVRQRAGTDAGRPRARDSRRRHRPDDRGLGGAQRVRLRRARNSLAEISASGQRDLAALSVASRQLRRMVG